MKHCVGFQRDIGGNKEQSNCSRTCCVFLGQVPSARHPACESKRESERKRQTFPRETNAPKPADMGSNQHLNRKRFHRFPDHQLRRNHGAIYSWATLWAEKPLRWTLNTNVWNNAYQHSFLFRFVVQLLEFLLNLDAFQAALLAGESLQTDDVQNSSPSRETNLK